MTAHYRRDSGGYCRPERHKLLRAQLAEALIYARQAEMRVHGRVPVSREMLAAAEHAVIAVTLHRKRAKLRCTRCAVAEAAHADDGIFAVAVHVKHRRKVKIYAESAQLSRRYGGCVICILRASRRGDSHIPGHVHGIARQARDHAALLIY